MEGHDRFDNAQKAFREFSGCHEHNFLATTILDDTRRSKKPLYMAWYDLKNAFPSMPHAYINFVLRRVGIPASLVELLSDVYSNAYTVVEVESGCTEPILQQCGVFQGCPLSPLLFIIGMLPLVNALQAFAPEHGIELAPGVNMATTAFADDLKVFSRSRDGIQRLHDLVVRFLQWTTMEAQPPKCAFLATIVDPSTQGRHKRLVDPLDLVIDGMTLPKLKLEDSYKYLGIREGFDGDYTKQQLSPKIAILKKQITALVNSGLAPWQVVKAIKVYVLSQLDYPLRHVRCTKSELDGLTKHLNKSLRHLLKLPNNSTCEFFAAPQCSGGLGLLPIHELRDSLLLTHAFQVLHSPDPNVQAIARAQLRTCLRLRFHIDAATLDAGGDQLLQHFLNGTLASQEILPLKNPTDIPNWWNDLINILTRAQLTFSTCDGSHFSITTPYASKPLTPKDAARHIKLRFKMLHAEKWASFKDQGRTVDLHGDIGSKFLTNGNYMWDQDYQFAIAARLNQVDTRSVLKRKGHRANGACRHCGPAQPETLAHVLQKCPHNEALIRARHDDALALIIDEIKKARPNTRVVVDRTVEGFQGPTLRPDIQAYWGDDTKTEAMIVDLAIAFEDSQVKDGLNIFQSTAAKKKEKYSCLARHLVPLKDAVFNLALVFGSLGSVATENHKLLVQVLRLSKAAALKLQLKISTMNIKASRKIWRHHCGAQFDKCRVGGFSRPEPTNRTMNDRLPPGHTTS